MLRFRVFLLAAGIALLEAHSLLAQSPHWITTQEDSLTAEFRNGRVYGSLIVTLNGPKASVDKEGLAATLRLTLLQPETALRDKGTLVRDVHLQPGDNRVPFEFTAPPDVSTDRKLLYSRLRYEVTSGRATRSYGHISLSRAKSNLFELRVDAASVWIPGEAYRIAVRAIHPVSGVPLPSVNLQASFGKSDPQSTFTNELGIGQFVFPLSRDAARDETGERELRIVATNGDFTREIEEFVEMQTQATFRINTDKPIYQPGQICHLRALVRQPSGLPYQKAGAKISVFNQRSQDLVYSTSAETSRFGILAADWPIPSNAAPGNYRVNIELDDLDADDGETQITVSRYELPLFRVKVKPERRYYRLGERASIIVSAEYLTGRPLTQGQVTIRRLDSFRRPSADDDEDPEEGTGKVSVAKASLTSQGMVRLVLPAEKDELSSPAKVSFVARVRDMSNNLERETRFEITYSDQQAFIEVLSPPSQHVPKTVYLAARYPDGSPASDCSIDLTEWNGPMKISSASARTNKFGHAAIRGFVLQNPAGKWAAESRCGSTNKPELAKVEQTFSDTERVALEVERTLLRAGDSIRARLLTAHSDLPAQITAWSGQSLITSLSVRPINGQAAIEIPYQMKFANEVTLVANVAELGTASRTVMFPGRSDLTVSATTSQREYKPGQDATLKVQVHDSTGKPVEAAVGLSIVDAAVLQVAGQDDGQDEDSAESTWLSLLDSSGPISEEYQLAATIAGLSPGPVRSLQIDPFYDNAYAAVHQWENDATSFLAAALDRHHRKTGNYPTNQSQLQRTLASEGVSWSGHSDSWDQPYRATFDSERAYYTLTLWSNGPDEKPGTRDDVHVLQRRFHYFDSIGVVIARILDESAAFPRTAAQFRSRLLEGGLNIDKYRDPFGRAHYLEAVSEEYQDWRVSGATQGEYGNPPVIRTVTIAIKAKRVRLKISSAGPDARRGTSDDFWVFSLSESWAGLPLEPKELPVLEGTSGPSGAIAGTITDPSGASIPAAKVAAIPETERPPGQYVTTADAEGRYSLRRLPPGIYRLRITMSGFNPFQMDRIPIRIGHVTRVDASLQVGSISETVSVEGAVPLLQTSMSMAQGVVSGSTQLAALRMRRNFPETLVWMPLLETDASGSLEVTFPNADSITEWRAEVLASDLEGRSGSTRARFKTFQPFYLEFSPPSTLTQGDRIEFPVTARNYLSEPQPLQLAFEPDSNTATKPQPSNGKIDSGGTIQAAFPFHADAPGSVTLRAIARGPAASDGVERKIVIVPDGQAVPQLINAVVSGERSLSLEIPQDALPGSATGEILVYLDPLAHIRQSLDGLLARPHGCGEQTISSTYPNLMLLRFLDKHKLVNPHLAVRAQKNLADGYARLLSYRHAGGGFSYWGGNAEPDLSLTLYALGFLSDASQFLPVSEEVQARAASWASQAAESGSHARTAAELALARNLLPNDLPKTSQRLSEILDPERDPYAAALMILAARDEAEARRSIGWLVKSGSPKPSGARYWSADRTPFHSWGLSAKLETTAVVIRALEHARANNWADAQSLTDAINSGLTFLLESKDRFGVWHSTRASVEVLRALEQISSTRTASVRLSWNQEPVALPANETLLRLPVSPLRPGKHSLTVQSPDTPVLVQLSTNHYEPWAQQKPMPAERAFFDLAVSCRPPAKLQIGQTVSCTATIIPKQVTWGMTVAEIGLPPGVQVDTAVLDKQLRIGSFHRYEIQPDRIVLYLWSSGQTPTAMNYAFRPRFAMSAQSSPSTVYSYYNPDARAVAPPYRLEVAR